MAKRRLINEGFFSSEGVGAWTMRQRLLVLGMIAIADDQGRMKGNPLWLRAQIFPYDAIPDDDFAADLATIESTNDTIMMYQVDGRAYIQLINWWDYQSLQWAKPSNHPPPPDWCDRIRQMIYKPERCVMSLNWPNTPNVLPKTLPNGVSQSDYLMSLGIINININTIVNSSNGGSGGKLGHIPEEYRDIVKE